MLTLESHFSLKALAAMCPQGFSIGIFTMRGRQARGIKFRGVYLSTSSGVLNIPGNFFSIFYIGYWYYKIGYVLIHKEYKENVNFENFGEIVSTRKHYS